MSPGDGKIGSALRFLASGGMANEDPDVVRELLTQAHDLAVAIVSDPDASATVRAKAAAFLEALREDTYGYGSETPEAAGTA